MHSFNLILFCLSYWKRNYGTLVPPLTFRASSTNSNYTMSIMQSWFLVLERFKIRIVSPILCLFLKS